MTLQLVQELSDSTFSWFDVTYAAYTDHSFEVESTIDTYVAIHETPGAMQCVFKTCLE